MEPTGPITDAFRYSNYAEAGLWAVIGSGFIVQAVRLRGRARVLCVVGAVAFLAFGGSDVVEARTGAWWRPWWLLGWKAACLVVFAGLLFSYLRARRGRGD
jgi:hypothetical protein